MSRKLSPQQQRLIAVLLLCLLSRSDLLVRRCDAVAVAVSAVNAAPTEEDSQPSSLPYVRGGDNLVGGGWLNIEGPLRGVKKRYDGLTPKGKFIAMTAVGFIGSRLVMDVATTAIKWAGAAFIVYEHSLKEERLGWFLSSVHALLHALSWAPSPRLGSPSCFFFVFYSFCFLFD